MTEDDVADRLWQWLTELLDTTVIHAFQGAQAPAEPYIVLNLTLAGSVRANQADWEFTSTGTGADEVWRQAPVLEWFWRFSLNCYGAGGATILRQLRSAQHVPTVLASLAPLSLFEVSDVRNVPELVNEEYVPRAQVDIELRGILRDGFVVDVVDTTEPIDPIAL
ncbi:hypothetical protein D3218_13080 [Aureimonas flava]|uniref:Phage neck terminator protein gp12-like domain-containing protein n=1 Tax=Aureimonas flava TaxID=2320271 RepID=A0A3A1WJU8_9HYPH|nr:hypothetical protein [Aureimonas flava]RIY00212.1 hypothetical protein D3218_13080 [Aureimonas flava]